MANGIYKAAKNRNLFTEEKMEARPQRSTVSAVELMTEQIQTMWGKDKKRVAYLLSLEISGAFDKVLTRD